MKRLNAEQVAYLRRVLAAEPHSLACKERGGPDARALYLDGFVAVTHDAHLPGLFHVLTPRGRAYLETLARAEGLRVLSTRAA